MGLDCSHDAWHGAYSAFMTWRKKLAEVMGLPPLELMDGFFSSKEHGTLYFGQSYAELIRPWRREELEKTLPIKWECLRADPLHELLYHSDCEGEIPAERCNSIANSLEILMPLLPEGDGPGHICNWKVTTQQFINGLRAAALANEPLLFC